MDKFAKYIPYFLVAVALFILWQMNRVQKLHTTLLVGMAGKLGVIPEDNKSTESNSKGNTKHKAIDNSNQDDEIVRIAERLYTGKPLTKKDKEFFAQHEKEINEETVYFLGDEMKDISKKIDNKQEITEDEASLYKEHYEGLKAPLKLSELTADINITETPRKDFVQPETEQDRKHLILTFFDDGIPKAIGLIANLYADKTGLVASTGNTAKILDKLLAEEKLKNQKISCGDPKRNKVFYGLTEWFDKNKFQKDYLKKIS